MKHLLTTLFLLCLCTLSAAGQTITRQKCATCGKLKVQCPYKGNHPVEKKCASCGKVISKCQYKGNHPKPQDTKSKQQTIASEKPKQPPKANQPKTVNVSYDASSNSIVFGGNQYKMVLVSGGTFMMGGTSEQGSDAHENEKPVFQVTLSDYYIGQTEVTQALWQAVMGSNPSKFKGDNFPVEYVSWDDCQKFIEKLNAKTGLTFKLPTEAQWEFAARGGNNSRGYKYSGSNNLDEVAWYVLNSNNKTYAVATKLPNELGIYDMSGNVCEWCFDYWYWYKDYKGSAQTNPVATNDNYGHGLRLYRGGGSGYKAWACRVSDRRDGHPDFQSWDIGLRLVLQP